MDPNHIMLESKDNVKVAIRIRPQNEKELQEVDNRKCVTAHVLQNSVAIDFKPEPRIFTYDYVADEKTTQDQVFQAVGRPITSACLSGYNCTIFAYGQTGAGKTYTILGSDLGSSFDGPQHDLRGILPRCAEYIFTFILRETRSSEMEYLVKCSFLEIYQEQIIDLLDLSGEIRTLQLHEDIKRGVYVEGLIEETVVGVNAAYELILTGNRNRHIGATSMNKESSRSHTVFTMQIESKESRTGAVNFKSSRFHLIDLAGSERQKASDAAGERLKEAGMINKSLSALGNVINSLVDIAEGKNRHVHYRDSKLTFLLKDSLGGNAKTCIIANISPAAAAFGETLSTLRFAQRAKLIRNKAIINEDTSGTVAILKEELRRLKSELAESGGLCPRCAGKDSVSLSLTNDRSKQLEILLEHNVSLRQETESLLQREITKRDGQIQTLQTTIAKYEKRIGHDKMILKMKETALERYSSGQVSLGEDQEALKQEVKSLRELLDDNPALSRLTAENAELKESVAELKSDFAQEPSSVMHWLTQSQEFTQELVASLKAGVAEREELKSLIQTYEKQNNSKEFLDQNAQIKLQYEERLEELKKTISTERRKHAESESSLLRKIDLQARRIESLHGQPVLVPEDEVQSLEEDSETSFNLLEEISPKSVEIEDEKIVLQAAILDLQNENSRLAVAERELIAVRDTLDRKEAELREVREEMEVMQEAGEYIKQQAYECSIRAEEKTAENSELIKEIEDLRTAMTTQTGLLASLETSKEDTLRLALQDNETLRQSISDFRSNLTEKETRISVLDTKMKDLAKELETVLAQERLGNAAIVDLQKRIAYLTQANSAESEALDTAKADLLYFQEENKGLTDQIVDLTRNVEELEDEKTFLTETGKGLQESIKSAEVAIEVLREQIAEYERIEIQKPDPSNSPCLPKDEIKPLLDDLRTSLSNSHKQEIAQYQGQLESAKTAILSLERKNLVLMQIHEDLRKPITPQKRSDFAQTNPSVSVESQLMEIEMLREENRHLKEENRTKMEILNNTNKNILATRDEIDVWKVTIEEKNAAIRALRTELKSKESAQISSPRNLPKPQLLLSKNPISESQSQELQQLRQSLEQRERELKALKENSSKRLFQAETMLEKQRKEVDLIAKQSELLRHDLERSREDLQTVALEKAVLIEKLAERSESRGSKRSKSSKIPRGELLSPVADTQTPSEKMHEELKSLNAGLSKISEFVFSLPTSSCNPEEADLVDGTIKAISALYEALESRELELSETERELQRKKARLELLENERSMWKQKMELRGGNLAYD